MLLVDVDDLKDEIMHVPYHDVVRDDHGVRREQNRRDERERGDDTGGVEFDRRRPLT